MDEVLLPKLEDAIHNYDIDNQLGTLDEELLPKLEDAIRNYGIDDQLGYLLRNHGLKCFRTANNLEQLYVIMKTLEITADLFGHISTIGGDEAAEAEFKSKKDVSALASDLGLTFDELIIDLIDMVLSYTVGAINLLSLARLLRFNTSPSILSEKSSIVEWIEAMLNEWKRCTMISELSEEYGAVGLEVLVRLYIDQRVTIEPRGIKTIIIDLIFDCEVPRSLIFSAMRFSLIGEG